jgi:hypothetical protein
MINRGAEFRKAGFQIHSTCDANRDGARPEVALGNAPTTVEIQTARETFKVMRVANEGGEALMLTEDELAFCDAAEELLSEASAA